MSHPGIGNPPALRVLQLIVASLVMSLGIFGVVAVMVAPVRPGAPGMLRTVVLVAVPVAVATALALRRVMLRRLDRSSTNPYAGDAEPAGDRGDDPDAPQRFSVATIMSSAILEGAALLGIVVYLMGGQPDLLAVAALPVVIMLLLFPTAGRWRRFVG